VTFLAQKDHTVAFEAFSCRVRYPWTCESESHGENCKDLDALSHSENLDSIGECGLFWSCASAGQYLEQ